jgi:crotonobetainyl-CoA:carnitine CoA-transferase CaiB-like acyl-CoA transferase
VTEPAGAIEGTIVIEIAEGWCAGAVAGRQLADLGARVVKIEPISGDRLRHQAPASTFLNLSTNKESLALDFAAEGTMPILRDVIAGADVLITDQTTLDDRGLEFDYDDLSARNSGLIACHFSPFGRTGSLAGEAGGELVAQAMGGIIATTGQPDDLPHRGGPPLAGHNAALMGGASILAALYERMETGQGADIDMSLYDGAVSLLYTFIPGYFISGEAPGPQGNKHPMAAPWDNYPTKDGWIVLCTPNDRQWHDFLRLIDRAELIEDPRFATNDERVTAAVRPLVDELVIGFLAERTTAEALALLNEHNVPAGAINDVAELIDDPQFQSREMVHRFEDASAGPYRTAGSIFKMSETPGRIRRPAPALGEHSDAVLQDLAAGKLAT